MHGKHLEPLELRTLLAATLDNGTLRVTGSDSADAITIALDDANQIVVDLSGVQSSFDATQVNVIHIDALGEADTITVNVNRATTILGGAGNDTITGSDGGADSVIGQQGNDTAELRGGDDTFVWDPGDASDLVDGQDGDDVLRFNGSGGDEIFEVSPLDNGRVRFFRNLGNINMDMGTTEHFVVNALGGNDTLTGSNDLADLIDLRFDAGDGDDSMSGTDGADTFLGGAGNDVIDGNRGNDTASMGAGNDTFIWDPGDGSDVVEGEAGSDTLRFNGSAGDEVMAASANGSRLRFTRDLGNINMDVGTTERLEVLALGGADTVTIGDLRATPTNRILVNGGEGNDTLVGGPARETLVGGLGEDSLRGNSNHDSLNGGTSDADDNTADRVFGSNGNDFAVFGNGDRFDLGAGDADDLIFAGTNSADQITVDFRIANNFPRARFITAEGTRQAIFSNGEIVTVEAGAGGDTVVMSQAASEVWKANFRGGSGNDLLVGGNLADSLFGESGSDTLVGLGGEDQLDSGSGKNVLVQ